MQIRWIRFREEYRFKGRLILFIFFSLLFIFLPHSNRALMASFFSTRCRNDQRVFSKRLNDRIVDYSEEARIKGIEKCADAGAITRAVLTRKLLKVRSNRYYKVQDMTHSYPYLTPGGKKLLNEIGRRLGGKIGKAGLKGSRFMITSMTRTSEMIQGLGRSNGNVSENSPHLNGNAFDISYAHFSFLKYQVSECDKWYMKEALAEVIYELRKENKCWATYERHQGCFHVVAR